MIGGAAFRLSTNAWTGWWHGAVKDAEPAPMGAGDSAVRAVLSGSQGPGAVVNRAVVIAAQRRPFTARVGSAAQDGT